MIARNGNGTQTPYQTIEQEFTCEHKQTHIVRFTQRNDVAVVRRQCKRCGAQVGNNLPKSEYNVARLPEWDESLREKWWQARSQRMQQAQQQLQDLHEQQRAAENAEWQRRYRIYLQSPQWQRLKKIVLERDNYTCQNCRRKVVPNLYVVDNRAEVHHLTYDGYNRIGESFAFELTTLCHDCHRRYHGRETGADE